MKKTAEKKRKKKMGLFPIFLLMVFLISLISCVYLLYGEVNKEIGIKDMEEDIQTFMKPSDTKQTGQSSASNDIDQTISEDEYVFDWDGMMNESEYVIGWLQIPGIERINYPIVQHPDDNQFFLNHDWKGNPQDAGAIFINKNSSPDFTDMNTILYGHRMRTGSMFGSLKYYADQSFMDENPYFNIYTPDGQKWTYEIICYSSVTDGSDAYLLHFNSPDERMAYYEMMLHSAITKRDVELNRFDTTIMMSTCNTTGYYDRVTILGKLIAIDLKGQPENLATE